MIRKAGPPLIIFLLAVIVTLAGCNTGVISPNEEIELHMPRSDVRDLLRDALLDTSGQPIFETVDTDYAFVDDSRFHAEGNYVAPDGTSRHGFVELAFGIEDGKLQVTIAGHDIDRLDGTSNLDAALTAEFKRKIADTVKRKVLFYRDVKPLADNILKISFVVRADPDAMVVPRSSN